MTSLLSWTRLPSVPLTLGLLALALPPVTIAAFPLGGNIWWVLKNGQQVFDRGAIGSSDPFTFSPHVNADINAQWLAQVVYYGAYRALGLEGVLALTSLVVAIVFGVLCHIAWRRTRSVAATSVAMCISSLVAVWNLTPRAQSLALVPFAASYWMLACGPRRRLTIAALGVSECLWANMHGSFFIGLLLTAVLLAGHALDVTRRAGWRTVGTSGEARFLASALAAQAIASLATPGGPLLYVYAWRLSTFSIVRQYVAEWAPTNPSEPAGLVFFASVAIAAMLVIRGRRGLTLGDVLVLAVFGLMGMQAMRNVLWWGLVSGPILAAACAAVRLPTRVAALGRGAGSTRHNVLRAAVVAVLIVATSPWLKAQNPLLPVENRALVPSEYPSASAQFLANQALPPRVYADQHWGSYLDWQLFPRYQLMVDSSIETHPADVWLDVLAIDRGDAPWQQRLDAYGVDVLLLNPARQAGLLREVERSPRWQQAFADNVSVVYVRAESAAHEAGL